MRMVLGKVDDAAFQAWANRVRGRIDSGQLKNALGKSLKNVGMQSLRVFKANTPVDTGQLRRAWQADSMFSGKDWVVKLYNNTEYASFVEEGHRQQVGRYVPAIGKRLKASWIPGQFFMKRSADTIEKQLPQLIEPSLYAFRGLFD